MAAPEDFIIVPSKPEDLGLTRWAQEQKALSRQREADRAREYERNKVLSGAELILQERKAHFTREGHTFKNDDTYVKGELALAAAAYALADWNRNHNLSESWNPWPWKVEMKPTPSDRIKELVKAGALIAAEIDRLQREE